MTSFIIQQPVFCCKRKMYPPNDTTNLKDHQPKDYFNLFIPINVSKNQIIKTSNFQGAMGDAGGTSYWNFVPFNLQELHKFIQNLYANTVPTNP